MYQTTYAKHLQQISSVLVKQNMTSSLLGMQQHAVSRCKIEQEVFKQVLIFIHHRNLKNASLGPTSSNLCFLYEILFAQVKGSFNLWFLLPALNYCWLICL